MISLKLIAERDVPEWSLIELQGTLSLPEDWGDQDAVELGTMMRSVENENVVQLTIGHHQMEGKVVKLKKSLAIIDVVTDSSNQPSRDRKVIGVITQKYVFKSRPRPLITKPGP